MEKEDMETLVSEDDSNDGCASRKRAELLVEQNRSPSVGPSLDCRC